MVKSVLTIDDDQGFQFYLSCMFKKEYPDITLLQAYDGKDASDLLAENKALPDIIFLDINMPIMDGTSFLKAHDAKLSGHHVDVIVMTSSDHNHDKKRIEQFECVKDYVVKPVFEAHIRKYIKG